MSNATVQACKSHQQEKRRESGVSRGEFLFVGILYAWGREGKIYGFFCQLHLQAAAALVMWSFYCGAHVRKQAFFFALWRDHHCSVAS